ncbi:hypothetical protein EJB05_05654 [Eragrostis curvula]|uniref:Uncharacterized protein n=1 Tax=Eragrostis curvula TaxID=38414 RepID=A0A5J9WDW4_9POAL|nr:hypothetical protein EJB05_05654 [Eragrostis curvula]
MVELQGKQVMRRDHSSRCWREPARATFNFTEDDLTAYLEEFGTTNDVIMIINTHHFCIVPKKSGSF